MTRVANKPVTLPKGVSVQIDAGSITVKGAKVQQALSIPAGLKIVEEAGTLRVERTAPDIMAMAGTLRANLNNSVVGVSDGFQRKLELVGVGYRAQAQGQNLNLTLGFSHPVVYALPEGISAETPSQTEIIVKGANKQQVGQVAAEIRAFRPPEPYKGKGVKYAGEKILRKEAKKK